MADTPRLKVKYQTEIVPALVEQLGIKNINCVPKLEKIVVNMASAPPPAIPSCLMPP